MKKTLLIIILAAIAVANIRTIASAILEGILTIALLTITIIFFYWSLRSIALSLDKIIELFKKHD